MTETPQFSGADLARQALANARAGAKNTPTPTMKKTRPTMRVHRGERTDPQGLAGILGNLTAEQGWEAGIGGGSIIDRWSELCPQYDGLVQAVHYDDARGRLDLRPSTHAYAAQLRILGGQLAKQINDKMGRPVVRTIRVLPVGSVQQPDAYTAVYAEAATADPEARVKTRETASPGYRDTLAVVLEHKPDRPPVDPYVEEAMQRQEAALRAGRPVDPERAEADTPAAGLKPGSIEASLAAAIAYKRSQAGGEPRRVFGTT
ncbi:DciA family protein [Streptomyces pseudovenezuelae]|uniref:DciA family protein n=1 Tax=Streptomyces pseudovenezuelae TaxID=67350 RepID=UPI002E801667|nr:DciA family protein [Streptomyces pseudovenezuelae]WUA94536.1 DciA family protein [Streptomyces pseudovenezuelae]